MDNIVEPFPHLWHPFTTDSLSGSGGVIPSPAIAPFWADLKGGHLYVKIIRDKNGQEKFGDIREIVVAENPSFSGFMPRTGVVVSWFQPTLLHYEFKNSDDVVRCTIYHGYSGI